MRLLCCSRRRSWMTEWQLSKGDRCCRPEQWVTAVFSEHLYETQAQKYRPTDWAITTKARASFLDYTGVQSGSCNVSWGLLKTMVYQRLQMHPIRWICSTVYVLYYTLYDYVGTKMIHTSEKISSGGLLSQPLCLKPPSIQVKRKISTKNRSLQGMGNVSRWGSVQPLGDNAEQCSPTLIYIVGHFNDAKRRRRKFSWNISFLFLYSVKDKR